MKKLVAVALVAALLLAASPATAQQTTTNKVLMTVGDVVLLRSFTFAATVVGFAVFVVGYPIIAIAGDDTAWEDLVAKPGRATFTRCIGCDLLEAPEAPEALEAPDEAS